MEKTYSQYEVIRSKVEREMGDEVRRFLNGEIDEEGNEIPEDRQRSLQGIWIQPDTKRYYTYGSPGRQRGGLRQLREHRRRGPGGQVQRRAGGHRRHDGHRQERRGHGR